MFKVTLQKYVWDGYSREDSSKWALFSHSLELPFTPVPGLGVNLPMQRSWRLRSVNWVVERQEFWCDAEDQYMDGDDDYFEDWLERLSDLGWTLVEGPHPKNFP